MPPLPTPRFAATARRLAALTLLLAGITHAAFAADAADHIRVERETFADLGAVDIFSPAAPTDLVLLLDGANSATLARQLAARGHLVALMPAQHLLDNARRNKDACLYPVTLLDVFSQHLQEKYRFARYQKPVLIGAGSAAALAYATLAQAPGNLFRAGIGIDFCPELALPAPLCKGDGNLSWSATGPQRYRLNPAALTLPWHRIGAVAGCAADAFGTALPTQTDSAAQIDAVLAPAQPATAQQHAAIDDLPLVELPATAGANDFFVVLLSGDGGWADIDKDIGGALNRQGIAVVGWNTLQYFWNRKTPEIAAADLQRVIAHYRQAWKKPRVLLVGFSLGADVLPFMVSRLPADERAQIADIALLSLSHTVDFEFHVTAWLGSNKGDTHQVAPELKKITEPVLCVYGTADDDTLCKDFKAPNVTSSPLPGDHHYEGDFQKVTKLILEHWQKSGSGKAQ